MTPVAPLAGDPQAPVLNVIGHVSGNLGLGIAARNVARAALTRGFGVTVYDLDPGRGRKDFSGGLDCAAVAEPALLPAGLNLFVLPPSTVAHWLVDREDLVPLLEREDCTHALLMFWELPLLPPPWVRMLELFDAVVAPSAYIESTLDFALSGTHVIRGLTPLDLPAGIEADRARFGLPADEFVAVTSFDPLSDPERKNPQAAIEAFRRAFGGAGHARLVVKLNMPAGGYGDPALDRDVIQPLVRQLRADGRTIVIADTLGYRDVLSLYASADAFVSLHRAEGLGLGLLESMALGKPVVATGWSGNKSFMSPQVSCLVRHRLVPVRASNPAYSTAMQGLRPLWAEPDIDDAALWLRRLAEDAELRGRIGAAGKAAFERYQNEALQLAFLDDLSAVQCHQRGAPRAMNSSTRRARALDARRSIHHAGLGRLERLAAIGREQFARHIGWRLK